MSGQYRLSLKTGAGGIAYLIYDGTGAPAAFRQYALYSEQRPDAATLRAIISSDNRLIQSYKEVVIGLDSHCFTLVPGDLFQVADSELYLEKTARPPITPPLLGHDTLAFNDSRLVYACDKQVHGILRDYFPRGKIFDNTTPLLLAWQRHAASEGGDRVFVQVDNGHFTTAYFKGADLAFANRFPLNSGNDFLYHVLMVYDRFKLKPESIPIALSGDIVEDSDMYRKLYRYVRHLRFLPASTAFPDDFLPLSGHRHINLISLGLCV